MEISIDTTIEYSEPDYDPFACNRAEILAYHDAGLNVAPAASAQNARSLVRNRLVRAGLEHLLDSLYQGQPVYAALGHTSGHLFAVCCPTDDVLNSICDELDKRGIARWAITPGLDDYAGLLLFQCKDGYVPDQPVRLPTGDVADIYGSGRCILLPPSIDPDGVVYRWRHREQDLPPCVHLSELGWLGVQKNPRSLITDPWELMPPRNQAFLTERLPQDYAETRLFAVACEASARNIPRSDAVSTLLPAARRNGLPETAVYRAVQSAYSRECETASDLAGTTLDRGYTWIAHHRWPARSTSALITACALLVLYRRAQGGVFSAAYTQLQAITRFHPDTIASALKYLVHAGFITKAPRESRAGPGRWRLGPQVLATEPDAASDMRELADVLLWDTHARERKAFGPVGLAVYWRLLPFERPARFREIAESLPFSKHQVDYALEKLARGPNPWVRETDEGWVVVRRPKSLKETPQFLDEEFAGTPEVGGKGKRRLEKLAQKQSQWAIGLIERGLYRQNRDISGGEGPDDI